MKRYRNKVRESGMRKGACILLGGLLLCGVLSGCGGDDSGTNGGSSGSNMNGDNNGSRTGSAITMDYKDYNKDYNGNTAGTGTESPGAVNYNGSNGWHTTGSSGSGTNIGSRVRSDVANGVNDGLNDGLNGIEEALTDGMMTNSVRTSE